MNSVIKPLKSISILVPAGLWDAHELDYVERMCLKSKDKALDACPLPAGVPALDGVKKVAGKEW